MQSQGKQGGSWGKNICPPSPDPRKKPQNNIARGSPEVGKTWAKSRLRDRIDAVIAHEVAESQTGTHEGAEALAAKTTLAVSEGTRRILRAMAGRTR
jgi:hypothetical protein